MSHSSSWSSSLSVTAPSGWTRRSTHSGVRQRVRHGRNVHPRLLFVELPRSAHDELHLRLGLAHGPSGPLGDRRLPLACTTTTWAGPLEPVVGGGWALKAKAKVQGPGGRRGEALRWAGATEANRRVQRKA